MGGIAMTIKIGPHTLVLDFDTVEYVSSEALGKLLKLNKRVQANGGRLFMCNVHGVLEVFEVPGLQTILNIRQSDREPEPEPTGAVYRLKPSAPRLDGAAITELDNLYQIWWTG
jgi:anti-anti-sigma regulatory factor